MSLLKRFDDDLKQALKTSERSKVSVIRMVKATVKNVQIEKGRELTDDEILSVLSTMAKQRRESIEQSRKGAGLTLFRMKNRNSVFFNPICLNSSLMTRPKG